MNTHFIKNLAMIVAGLLMTISCSGNSATKEKEVMEKNAKVLIVFFSHAGENYSVGNIKVGNTKLVADEIQKVTGGDEFEIVADKNYDLPYNELINVAKEEPKGVKSHRSRARLRTSMITTSSSSAVLSGGELTHK